MQLQGPSLWGNDLKGCPLVQIAQKLAWMRRYFVGATDETGGNKNFSK